MIDRRPASRPLAPTLLAVAGLALLLALLSAPAQAQQTGAQQTAAQQAEDADWPCEQRMIPEVSAGMVWAGPPLDAALKSWQDDEEVARLAGELSARSVPLEAAKQKVAAFADGLTADREARLTRLFAGLLQTINSERHSIIEGIERYTRKQRALADRIEETGSKLDKMTGKDVDQKAQAELQRQQEWDVRIYEDREHSTKYLCQQPIDLEQRLFQLARTIQEKLQ